MNRRELLAATGALATTAVAGCQTISIGQSDDSGSESGASESSAAAVQSTESGGRRRVVVSSTGEADGEPDLAVLTVGVQTRGKDVGPVRNDLATAAEQLRSALLDAGLDEKDVTTNRYSIRDRIDRRQMEEDGVRPTDESEVEQYRYYEGVHSFSVEVRDIERVGEIIDAAVDAGADDVGHVTFTLSDERRSALRETALDRALETAREEADHIASEVGAEIREVTVVDASEGRVETVSREYHAADAAATPTEAAQSTSVEPGDVTVSAAVRVEYTMA